MTTPYNFLVQIVDPTLRMMATNPSVAIPVSDNARILLLAIAGQESGWNERRQIGIGEYYPQKVGARSYWGMESTWGGPVAINDVFQKEGRRLSAVCSSLDIPYDAHAMYEACAWNDTLACTLARLLLWTDPRPLPGAGQISNAYAYYKDNWKPGAPRPDAWGGYYNQSVQLVKENPI